MADSCPTCGQEKEPSTPALIAIVALTAGLFSAVALVAGWAIIVYCAAVSVGCAVWARISRNRRKRRPSADPMTTADRGDTT